MASDSGGSADTSQTDTLTTQYIQVQFTDTSSGADNVLWNFGDGETSTERNPKHTYTNNGDYTVILTVNNAAGQAVSQENVQITGVGTSSEGEGDNGDSGGDTETIYGCTDPLALNYDEYANRDDNSCEYSTAGENGDNGDNGGDSWPEILTQNGILDMGMLQESFFAGYTTTEFEGMIEQGTLTTEEANSILELLGMPPITYGGNQTTIVYGCTDSTAFNYNSNANTDNGSCIPIILGCTDPTATNYVPSANTDNVSCIPSETQFL